MKIHICNPQVIVKLGGHVTDSGRGCTHVVSSRVTRTVKFLSGISVCQHIVTPDWVEACGKEERFVEEGTFTLTDSDAEQMFQMDVASSLARAKQRKLLEVHQRLFFKSCHLYSVSKITVGLCIHTNTHIQCVLGSFTKTLKAQY